MSVGLEAGGLQIELDGIVSGNDIVGIAGVGSPVRISGCSENKGSSGGLAIVIGDEVAISGTCMS